MKNLKLVDYVAYAILIGIAALSVWTLAYMTNHPSVLSNL